MATYFLPRAGVMRVISVLASQFRTVSNVFWYVSIDSDWTLEQMHGITDMTKRVKSKFPASGLRLFMVVCIVHLECEYTNLYLAIEHNRLSVWGQIGLLYGMFSINGSGKHPVCKKCKKHRENRTSCDQGESLYCNIKAKGPVQIKGLL